MNSEYLKWLNYPELDSEIKNELLLIKDNKSEIESRFTAPLAFGTAGLRGIMGAGIARMNIYTVAQTTQALAELIIEEKSQSSGVVIAYDSRINSRLFAETAASVLAANKIKVYIFGDICPTPELSFAILSLKAAAGINITASHNPKEYNGYKVYYSDGAQLPPEHASAVSKKAAEIDIFEGAKKLSYKKAEDDGLIITLGAEMDNAFLNAVLDCRINKNDITSYGSELNIIYTLHGAGYKLVPEALRLAGLSNLKTVAKQCVPDGSFPTVKSPNPENKEGFAMAIDMALEDGGCCSLIIGTDPDADRAGVVVKDHNGLYTPLTGNQIGILLTEYIIEAKTTTGTMPASPCAIKSVVSTPLFDKICIENGVTPLNVLTGFKYIGNKIDEFEKSGEYNFIFGFEESCGYLAGTYARDKDAVGAVLMIVEMASYYHGKGKTLYEVLQDIYKKYGYYGEAVKNIAITGAAPMRIMSEKMEALRKTPLKIIGGIEVVEIVDFAAPDSSSGLPKSDMLSYSLADGARIIIRPSGTEPKIKVYISAKASDSASLSEKLEMYLKCELI